MCCGVAACKTTTTDSISGVASWQLSISPGEIVTGVEWRAIKDLELAPGLESVRLLLERAQLLTPDPRLHLLGERADLQKSVCLSMLCMLV